MEEIKELEYRIRELRESEYERIRELENRIEQLERDNVTSKEYIHLITNNISKLTEAMDKVSIIVKSIVDKVF